MSDEYEGPYCPFCDVSTQREDPCPHLLAVFDSFDMGVVQGHYLNAGEVVDYAEADLIGAITDLVVLIVPSHFLACDPIEQFVGSSTNLDQTA